MLYNKKIKRNERLAMLQFKFKEIIDIHAHIYPEKIASKAVSAISSFYGLPMEGKGTAEDLVESGQKAKIQKFVISSIATAPAQVRSINDFIAGVCHTHSGFIGFGTMHQDFPNPKTEVERMLSLGLKGIKLHPDFQKRYIDEPLMFPLYEASEGRLPILFHIGDYRMDYSSPLRLARILKCFPDLVVIASHLGAYRVWDEWGTTLLGKNVYIDTSSALMFLAKNKAVEIIRSHGVDKVLFGTDYPLYSHQGELQRFLSLGLTPEENKMILSENTKKLLKMVSSRNEISYLKSI